MKHANKTTEKFLRLVAENPNLPIEAMVRNEVVNGEDYGSWAGWRRNLVETQKRPWIYLITGRPITKKNSGRYVRTGGRSRLLPSKQFEAYEEAALWQLRCQARPDIPLACPVNLRVEYYMPNRKGWPDLMGLIQATADILQDAEILADDGYIARLTGCQIAGIDKVNPRAEIIVMPLDPEQSVLYELHPDFTRGREKRGKRK